MDSAGTVPICPGKRGCASAGSGYHMGSRSWTRKKQPWELVMKYVCNACGYIYDPELGDPDGGLAPGTAFEDIPDDWVCPDCGVGKEDFTAEG